jgi:hypothetical protein
MANDEKLEQDLSPEVADLSRSDAAETVQALTAVLNILNPLSMDAVQRVLETAATYFGATLRTSQRTVSDTRGGISPKTPFSDDRTVSPKEFMIQKQARSDVDKVACLAYYLTHYRDTPYFKTLDISKLNTEAAQVKFSNPTVAVDNATKRGLLVPAEKGQKQLSGAGEQYVAALPDREAALAAMAGMRKRRKSRKPAQPTSNENAQDTDAKQAGEAP